MTLSGAAGFGLNLDIGHYTYSNLHPFHPNAFRVDARFSRRSLIFEASEIGVCIGVDVGAMAMTTG
jgi:hypothetical protein